MKPAAKHPLASSEGELEQLEPHISELLTDEDLCDATFMDKAEAFRMAFAAAECARTKAQD